MEDLEVNLTDMAPLYQLLLEMALEISEMSFAYTTFNQNY